MSHPNREEWMAFLYEDLESTEKNRLSEHLKSCASCQQQVARWRTTMRALDEWQLPERKAAPIHQPWLRWAAAAAIFLAAGVSIGAAARPKADLAAIQKAIEPQIKASIQQELAQRTKAEIDELSKMIAKARATDQEALVVTLRELESRRVAELQALRKDLETVAVSAQNQFVRLASYTGMP